MKPMKAVYLSLFAALTMMAFVEASSAMAENTTLCTGDGNGCGVTHVHATSVGNAKLLTSFGTTECTALALGDVKKGTNTLANPLVLEVNFTYSSCKLGSTNCTATEESAPAEIKVLKEGHETTKATGEGLVHLVCGSSIDCSYTGTGVVAIGKGSLLSTQTNGEVSTSEAVTTKETGGFFCPKTSKLDITMTSLSATYISS